MKVYIRLLFAFLGACFLVFSYVCLNYLWTDKIEPKKQLSQEVKKLKKLPVKDVDYGLPLYDDAMALIRKERVYEGISKLHELLKLYPDSSKCDEANDILGEYNCDNLFSRKENKFKTEYEVKRGDALNSIAKRSGTTPGFILKVNKRLGANIQPGERLIVCELKFSVIINLNSSSISLRTGDNRLFKNYKLEGYKLPQGVPKSFDTEIHGVVVGDGNKFMALGSKDHVSSKKQIRTKRRGVSIVSVDQNNDNSKYTTGFFVVSEDLEELAILLKSGINVYVRS